MTDDTHDTTGKVSERETDHNAVVEDATEAVDFEDGERQERKDAQRENEDEGEQRDEGDEGGKETFDESEEADVENGTAQVIAETEEESNLSERFGRGVDRYVLWGALLLSGLLGTVAAFNLYFQVGSVIDVWIASRYQPIFQAGFNLVVLLVAGYVAVTIADRLDVGK